MQARARHDVARVVVQVRHLDRERRPGRHDPRLGEHTDAVLRETLGMGDTELARLRAEGVIGGALRGR